MKLKNLENLQKFRSKNGDPSGLAMDEKNERNDLQWRIAISRSIGRATSPVHRRMRNFLRETK